MWHLSCHSVTKRYPNQLLFKNLNYTFEEGRVYAVTGSNGSGKSTLLKIIAGLIPPSKGQVKLFNDKTPVDSQDWYKYFSICAPYMELIEEFTMQEHINFHKKFKPQLVTNLEEIIDDAGLLSSLQKPISSFSSGMRQRLKLILCLCFEAKVLLLDEPTSHLDKKGKNWYVELLKRTLNKKIILIFSNEEDEYVLFTNKFLNIEN